MRPVKILENELMRQTNEMAKIKNVGTEEYVNATKAQNQTADAINKLKSKLDPNTALAAGVAVISLLGMTVYNENHITDTKIGQIVMSIFDRLKKK